MGYHLKPAAGHHLKLAASYQLVHHLNLVTVPIWTSSLSLSLTCPFSSLLLFIYLSVMDGGMSQWRVVEESGLKSREGLQEEALGGLDLESEVKRLIAPPRTPGGEGLRLEPISEPRTAKPPETTWERGAEERDRSYAPPPGNSGGGRDPSCQSEVSDIGGIPVHRQWEGSGALVLVDGEEIPSPRNRDFLKQASGGVRCIHT